MKQSKVDFNLQGMEEFKRAIGNTYRARVGIIGEKVSRSDGGPLNNAELGMIQMFGSITGKIPPRDFLIMPIESHQREIIQAMSSASVQAAFASKNYKRVLQLLGAAAEAFVQEAFESGGFGQWAPNAPKTISAKGSDAPLIDTGQLRRAITSDVVKAEQA